MLDHPIFTRWPEQDPDRLQLFCAPTPNGVKVGIDDRYCASPRGGTPSRPELLALIYEWQ